MSIEGGRGELTGSGLTLALALRWRLDCFGYWRWNWIAVWICIVDRRWNRSRYGGWRWNWRSWWISCAVGRCNEFFFIDTILAIITGSRLRERLEWIGEEFYGYEDEMGGCMVDFCFYSLTGDSRG